MSWFGDLAQGVWGGVKDNIVPAIATIYAGNRASKANIQAAAIAGQAQQANLEAIRAGQRESLGRYDAVATAAQPANTYLRTVMAQDPNKLTPQQQQQMEEVHRETLVGLNNSSVGGSARAVTGALRKINSTTYGDMVARNQTRGDRAAEGLAGQGQQAQMAAAGVPARAGEMVGRAATDAGTNAAGATLANGSVMGNTFAALAGYANRNDLDKKVAERYQTVPLRTA